MFGLALYYIVMMRFKIHPIIAVPFLLFAQQVNAIILYSGDNEANRSAPDTARADIYASIGRIAGTSAGSVVHIRGKYLLTANHVNTSSNLVTFDGITSWPIDTEFAPVQIGPADMKLIKLQDDPGLPETLLFTDATGDTAVDATIIGWGVGRDPDVDDSSFGPANTWSWGDAATMHKRWGTNRAEFSATADLGDYTYTFLTTSLNANAGDNEAALTIFDSGSGFFINDSGTWKLAGIATAVSTSNSSTFSFSGDTNFIARVTTYASIIEDAIPDPKTFEDWLVDNSLYGDNALDTADTDDDGIPQFLEFAYGGNPHSYDREILPIAEIIEENGSTYLEISLTRPTGLNDLTYTAQTTSDLINWPNDSSGIEFPNPTPVANGNGTETITYRRAQATIASPKAFIRIVVTPSN